MTPFEIPTSPKPETFEVTLGGNVYEAKTRWNAFSSCWVLDLADQGGATILSGLPLITGADLVAQFAYLDVGGMLIVQTDHNQDVVPDFDTLGSTGHLYFVTP